MDWRVRSIAQILVLGCLLVVTECGTAEQRVVCYYTNWSVYRPGTAKFSPQNINPYLCTHLIYAFGGFTKDNALKPFDKYQDIEKGGYAKFTGLKTYNKNLKTMLAVGGWNEGSSRFSPMVADPERRKEFVRNTVKFLRQNHFDGLDLDWEYPAFRDGGKPRDRDNYASLVQELREAYDRESSKTGRPRLLLSMAVPAGIEYIDKGYDIPKLNKYLDFINLLSYDYHSSYEPAVNHHSPLYPLEEDNEYNFDTELTVDYTIKHLLESGASADKIVLGIPTYGRSYTLFNEDATDIGSPADGPGEEGDATREKGYLAYYEICEGLIDSEDWEVVSPNPNAMGPYAYKGNQWVGYDDEAIVKLKAQYVNENGLGGIMFWSIDNDDFRGKCHNRPYPLIEAAKEAMLSGSEKTSIKEKLTRPTKTRTDSNFIGRKLGAGRRRTTEAPAIARQDNSRKRVNPLRTRNRPNTRENSDEEETQIQLNGRTRGQFFDSEEDEDVENNSKVASNVVRSIGYDEDEEKETSRPQDKNRARNGQGRRRKPDSTRRRGTTVSSISEQNIADRESHRSTTPQPPTTPDPGTDFKCEDEGFFSHPRDCKKYFWCLDAGPGGLGIVAHHFTCPAGLVFNKAADSCDYPRNVVCPKAKPAESPTTRAPIVAATSRPTRIPSTNRRSSTTTTTEASEYSEEYEYYDDEDEVEDKVSVTTTTAKALQYQTISRNRPTTGTSTAAPTTTTQIPKTSTSRSYQTIPSRGGIVPPITSIEESVEEDPKVIQELIELIKKAGGIEELEKQLHLQGKGGESSVQTGSVTDKASVTPATISRSLYERVLNRQAANSGTAFFRRTTVLPTTIVLTTEVPEKLDPQASIAQRSNPNFRNGPGQAQFEGLDDIPEVKSLRRERPQYVTINRQRPSTQSPDESSDEIVEDNSDGASAEDKLIINQPEVTSTTQKETPGYVDIRRTRTSTTRSNVLEDEDESDVQNQRRRPATSESETEDEDDEGLKNIQTVTEAILSRRRNQFTVQKESSGTTSRYINIQRGSTTTTTTTTTEAIEQTSSEDGGVIFETTTEAAINSPTNINIDDKIDDKISISQTNTPNDATTEQSVLHTTTSVIEPLSTTQTLTFVSTDLPVHNIDPSTTILPITVKLLEESSTAATFPTVSSTSTQESSSDEPVTRGSTTVVQPKPFGFHRRTRPTTTTTELTPIPETTTSSVSSDSGRVKVPSETVRLPTLKELIGYSKTNVAHNYTSTTPNTLSIKILLDDNALNPSENTKYVSEAVTPVFEKELLMSEEIGSIEATGIKQGSDIDGYQSNKYTSETAGNNYYENDVGYSISELDQSRTATESSLPATLPIKILKQDKSRSRRRKIKLVNIPVRILESDKPLTDVILEVPEYKLNSVLRSLLRVEIINQDNFNGTNNNSEKSKDINTYSQRTRYNPNPNHDQDDYPTTEHESDELLNEDANTNFINTRNSFTSTTPGVSTVRGSPLITPWKSRNQGGFYVTKSIESNGLYENTTPPTASLVTELDNEITQQFTTTNEQISTSGNNPMKESSSQQFSTTTEQLSTRTDNPSMVTKGSLTNVDEFYAEQKESASGETWPSMISTSLENLNNVLAINDDISSAEVVTQEPTITGNTDSTEYSLSTTEIVNNVKSTTGPTFTESDERFYTSNNFGETIGSYSTEEFDTTYSQETSEPNLNSDIHTTTSWSQTDRINGDLDFHTATGTATPDLQRTTIHENTDSVTESSTLGSEATSTTTYDSKINTISEDLNYNTAANTGTPDLQRTTIHQNTDSVTESSTMSSEVASTTVYGSKINTISEDLDYNTAANTETSDLQRTIIHENTDSIRESSTLGSEVASTTIYNSKINTISEDLDYNTPANTGTSDLQRTTINKNTDSVMESSALTMSSEVTSTTIYDSKISTISEDQDYYTANTATPNLRQTKTNQSTNFATESSTSGTETTSTTISGSKIDMINEIQDYYTARNTAIPDLQGTTIDQNTISVTESSTSSTEATKLSTGFNSYTETSSLPNFDKTTVSDFEGISTDSTKFISTERNTPNLQNTETYTEYTKFNTEVNPYTETISADTASDFEKTTVTAGSNSNFESTTFSTGQPLNDNDSVLHTGTTDFASSITSSVYNPDVQTTTFSSLNPETSTLDFITSTASTGSTSSDSITTHIPFTTITEERKTDSFSFNEVGTIDSEDKTTMAGTTESTTESDSTVTITTSSDYGSITQQPRVSDIDLTYSTRINQQIDTQTVRTLVTSGSESTSFPSSNDNEITTSLTTTKKEESVNKTRARQDVESLAQIPISVLPTELSTNSEFSRRGFYRSPTAIPGKKTVRKRIIRKRIYGVRRPHIEAIGQNEEDNNITKPNTNSTSNATNKPKQRFIRRRIINHSTGKIIDERLEKYPRVLQNQTTANNSNPEFVQKVNDSSEFKNNLANKLLRHRTIYRRRPANNQTNSSIEANISSQNNSASNDVQSSSVSSTNPNQRRRIVVQRFRYRGSGLTKSTTISPNPSPSPSSQSLLATNAVSQLNSTKKTVEDKLQEDKHKTSGQDYTDVTNDNLSSGSEIYGRVSVYGREELPRTESISEALKSGDERTDSEINLFKTRTSNPRKPGTLLRPTRPNTSTSIPENEIATTISPSIKPPNNIATRRRFRLGQRPATPANNAEIQSEPSPSEGETLKLVAEEAISENSDQTSHAQEIGVTVADRESSSTALPVVTGRPSFRTAIRRRTRTTEAPQVTVPTTHPTIVRQRQRPKPFEKISENAPATRPRHPAIIDYDYYEDSEERIVGKPKLSGKVSFTATGSIRCLDQGNFPHPTSCKKFITCSRMVNGQVVGTEYTCPKRLSYDPVGGICNWSAGLGCKE